MHRDCLLVKHVDSINHNRDPNLLVSSKQPLFVDCYESQRVLCWLEKVPREESFSNETNLGSVVDQRRALVHVSNTIIVDADHNLQMSGIFVPS